MTRLSSYSIVKWTFNATLICSMALLGASAYAQTQLPQFSKSFNPGTIGPGSTSQLVFTITNGSTSVDLLAFTDNLPAGVVIADPSSATGNCESSVSAPNGGTTISMTDGRLGANQSCTVRVNVTSSTQGTYTNISGDLTSSGGNSGNATADLTVATDRPGFSKDFSPASISLGDRSTLTFTIDNSANAGSEQNLNFSDNLPVGLELADPVNPLDTCIAGTLNANAGSNSLSHSAGDVPAGTTCLISVDVVATGIGTLVNTSSNLTSGTSSTLDSGFATADVSVEVSVVHLDKTFVDDPVAPGGTVELNFDITNRDRSATATNIAFTDDLDAILSGLAAVGLPASACGGTLSGTGLISLSGGTLAAGANCNFSATLQVPGGAATGGYTNLTGALTADLDGSPFTGNMASDTLFVDVGPVLTKTFLANPVGGGDIVSMEFTITNSSATEAATDITFVDNISQFISGTVSSGLPVSDVCGTGSLVDEVVLSTEIFGVELTGGNLAAGASCTFTADVIIPDGAPGGVHTNITEEISATVDGLTRVGAPAEASLTVVETPELIKLFTDDPVAPGGSVTLDFTLNHPDTASGAATDIGFTDDLDATLSGLVASGLPASDICGAGSSLSGTSLITFSGGSLAVGESCNFSVSLAVPGAALPGNYDNQTSDVAAVIGSTASIGTGGADTLTVAGLDIDKAFLQSPVIAGATVTLEFTVTNSSTLDATAIAVTDNLDDFINNASAVGSFPVNDICGSGSTLSASSGSRFLTLADGNLLAGENCVFNVDVLVPAVTEDGPYGNTTSNLEASLNGSPLVLDPADAVLEISSELLGLSKAFADGNVSLGTTTSLDFLLTNLSGTEAITDIAFSDNLDAVLSGLQATGLPVADLCGAGSSLSGTSILSFTGGSLPAGASCAFSVDLAVPSVAEGVESITNTTSSVSGLVGNLAVNGAPASASALVVDFSFIKEFDATVNAGGSGSLTFSIENNGASSFDRLFFTDNLESVVTGMVATGLPASDVCGAGSLLSGASVVTLTKAVLAPSESCQFSINFDVPAGTVGGEYQNITSALTNEAFDVSVPAVATLVVNSTSATLRKWFDASIDAGTTGILNFEIVNTGGSDLVQLAFSDDLEAVLHDLKAEGLPTFDVCGAGSTLSGSSVITLAGGNLLAGESCQFSAQVKVPGRAEPGQYTNITSELTEANTPLTGAASAMLTVNPGNTIFVTLCHKPGTPAEKTLILPEAALGGHFKHGDTPGICADQPEGQPGKYQNGAGAGNNGGQSGNGVSQDLAGRGFEVQSVGISSGGGTPATTTQNMGVSGVVTASVSSPGSEGTAVAQTGIGEQTRSASIGQSIAQWFESFLPGWSTDLPGDNDEPVDEEQTLCHYSTVFGHTEISVASDHWDRHLDHGDTVGACSE